MSMKFDDIKVPEELDVVVNKSITNIRNQQRIKRRKSWVVRGCGMAAAFACLITLGFSNYAFAAKLPLIGHIFEVMQDKFAYGGDYNGIGNILEDDFQSEINNTENQTQASDDKKYTQTVDGVTVTLSEIYCNKQAIYLSMEIHSDEAFPDMHNPQIITSEKYSFNPSKKGDCLVLNGDKIDDYTYAGLVRFDLGDKVVDMSEYENTFNVIELPDCFSFDLVIDQISGALNNPPKIDNGLSKEEQDQMSDEEWKKYMAKWAGEHPGWDESQNANYYGPWKFSLDVVVNDDDAQVIDLENKAENGIGFSAIAKDRFEITVYGLNKMSWDFGEYFPVLLDADGRLMGDGDAVGVNTVAINDSNIHSIDLFLVDSDLWLNSLKGEWWKSDEGLTDQNDIKNFKRLLIDKCAYHTEVHFD